MRLDNIKNFRGYSYITKEEFGLTASNATMLENLFTSNSKINPNYIDTTATTITTSGNILSGNGSSANPLTASISITENSGITGNGDSTALGLDFTIIGENLTKVGKSGTGTIAITGTGLTYNGNALNTANGLVQLDANAKILTSQLPDLAITKVYTAEVSNSLSTIEEILAAKIPANGVQSGDVVIVSGTTEAIKRVVGGSYIFTDDVAQGETVTGKYAKMYTPTGTVVSVNGETPDASGIVTVGWEDIGDKTVTSITYTAEEISINNVAIATKAYAEQVAATAESNAKDYTDTQIDNLVNANDAISITEVKDIVWGTKDAQTGIATASVTGYVVAVLDENGMQCFPQITYSGTTATISANWGANTPASGFKAVVVKSTIALAGLA